MVRQNHLGYRVDLTEGFMVTGAPAGCREIHIAARLGLGRVMVGLNGSHVGNKRQSSYLLGS